MVKRVLGPGAKGEVDETPVEAPVDDLAADESSDLELEDDEEDAL